MPIKLDGRATSAAVKANLAQRVSALGAKGIVPGLGTLLVGNDPASAKYVAGKHSDCEEVGIRSIKKELPADASEQEIIEAVEELNNNPACTAFIVQLPLPQGVDMNAVINHINPNKDADGMHPYNLGELVLHTDTAVTTPLPCTPRGIIELLNAYNLNLEGKNICVLGRGITVGRTIGLLLTAKDVNATVTLCHTGTHNVREHLRQADVIIAAMGQPSFVKKADIRPGAFLVDVGVSRIFDNELGRYRIAGDIDKACYEISGAYTPNPGGVGPMTRAMLLTNVVEIAERSVQ